MPPDFGAPVAANIQVPDPNKPLQTLSGLMGIQRQKQALQIGQQQLQVGEGDVQQAQQGELLNVRNRGDFYVVTRYPEEYDAEKPNRAVKFTNLGECQNFVSDWYSRQTHDPRAR